MSTQLILNSTFNVDIFKFMMLPPYIEEVQHTVQNGDTLVDTIAYKDRFSITWPYLNQDDYNTLINLLYSNQFLQVDYTTDQIQRLWDGATAFTVVSANFSGTPVYLNGGIITDRATTNLSTNPSGEDASVSDVVAEDANITVTNSLEESLFGIRSFKAVNSDSADYEPDTTADWRGYANTLFKRTYGYGSLGISYGVNNIALYTDYTAGNPDDVVWTYNNITKYNSTFPIILLASSSDPYMEQIVTTSISTDYIFQATVSISGTEDAVVEVRDSSDILLGSTTITKSEGYGPWIIPVAFTATTATTKVRVRIGSNLGAPSLIVQDIMLYPETSNHLVPYSSTFVGTDGSPVNREGLFGYGYDSTKSMQGAYGLTFSSTHAGVKQSVFLHFKSSGWAYNNVIANKKMVLFSTVMDSDIQASTEVYFYQGDLYIYINGLLVTSYDVSGLATDDWHSICMVVNDDTSDNLRVYLNYNLIYTGTVVRRILLGTRASINATGKFCVGNTLWNDGSYHNQLTSGVAKHFDGFISDFTICHYEMDKYFSLRGDSLLNLFNTDYDFNSTILNNEEISLYLRGGSENAYAARTVYFSVDQELVNTVSCSMHVFSPNIPFRKLLPVGRVHNLSWYYLSNDGVGPWYHNSGLYERQTWNRLYLDNISESNYAIFPGAIGLSVPIGSTLYIDGIQVEYQDGTTSYCDGDQTNCSWDGSVNNSTSSRANQTLSIDTPTSIYNTESDFSIFTRFYVNSTNIPAVLYLGDAVNLSSVQVQIYSTSPTSGGAIVEVKDMFGTTIATQFFSGSEYVFPKDSLFDTCITKSSDSIKIYLNGNLITSIDLSNYRFLAPQYFYMGHNLSDWSQINVVDLGVYNSELQPSQVADISTWDAPLTLNSKDLLLAYYNFEDTLDLTFGSANSVNSDVKRLRKKAVRKSINTQEHVKNRANFYEVKVTFQES